MIRTHGFAIVEDVGAETVTVSIPSAAEPLTRHPDEGRDSQADYAELRAWIERHGDDSRGGLR